MSQPRHLHLADLQGLARLSVDGVAATTDLVEHLHHAITRVPGVQAVADSPRTRGIAGRVYRSIHGLTRGVGATLDWALGGVAERAGRPGSTPERDRVLAILNGVLGDHLAQTGNPLAITMSLRRGRGAADDDPDAVGAQPGTGHRLAILLHGLCRDEQIWQPPPGSDPRCSLPIALAAAGWTVLHLRYNSGRPIHANGRDFDEVMERLVADWPTELWDIALVGHSMGGLIARSAVHQSLVANRAWTQRLARLIFLGTPHHGAPLERAGHGVDRILGATRYSAPFVRLGRVRSAGITDLRHGNVLPGDPGGPARIPAGTECFAVAATLDRRADTLRSRYLGDGLVPVPSALGRHNEARLSLPIDRDRQFVAVNTGHIELAYHPEVVGRVLAWMD